MKRKIYNVGLAHGVFDVLHTGHINHFKEAKKLCKKLIVSVTDNKFVKKGLNRPVFNSSERIQLLSSIKYVDQVILSKNITAVNSIKRVKPNIYFKGLDYSKMNLKEQKNLNLEIKELKKIKGIFHITKSKLKSSSEILNKNSNILKKDIKAFLAKQDKKRILSDLKFELFSKRKNNLPSILLVGEQILDYYTRVKIQGKSQKSSIVSNEKLSTQKFGGGTILVANLLCQFLNNISYIINGNHSTEKISKKYIENKKKIKTINTGDQIKKILIKERFIDSYSKTRLFQLNQNQIFYNINNKNSKFQNTLVKAIKKFQNIIIFDYGYGFIDDNFANTLKNKKKIFYINCQTNSSNFGFNLFSKFKKAEIMCVDEAEFRLTVKNNNDSVFNLIKKNTSVLKNYKVFIVTCGSKGCYILNKKKIDYVPTVYESTLDTTGCGDVFFSTFIYFYLTKKFSFQEIAFLSHVAAGLHGLDEGNKNVINKNIYFQSAQSLLK